MPHSCPPAITVRRRLRSWFAQTPGRILGASEQVLLEELLSTMFGYHILQLGYLGWKTDPLASSRIRNHVVVDDDIGANGTWVRIYASVSALPIATDSIDAVVLAHALEFEDEPHQVLREVERILIPEGRLIVISFNPWSLCGLWQLLYRRSGRVPWCGNFFSQVRLRDWLALLGFEIEANHGLLFRPPMQNATIMEKLKFVEQLGNKWWPIMAGVNVTVARKRVSTLTPIKPRWRPRRSLKAAGVAEPSARIARDD